MIPSEWNNIYNVDCLVGLRGLKSDSIDLVVTSPPYNIGNFNNHGQDLGTYAGNNMSEDVYQDWQLEILSELHRVVKPSGSVFYNHKVRIKDGVAIHPLEWIFKSDFTLKQEITWNQGRGANSAKIRFFPFSERIYWLTKTPKTRLNNVGNLKDVWDVPRRTTRRQSGHLAVMPDEIVENILSAFPDASNVLDPFAGSGTTLAVAKESGRDYLGFEICPDYYRAIKDRMGEV